MHQLHETSACRPLRRPLLYEQDGVQHSVMGTSLPGPSGASCATAAASDSAASRTLVLLCWSSVLSLYVSLHVVQSILSPWCKVTSFWVNLQFTQVFCGMLTLGMGVTVFKDLIGHSQWTCQAWGKLIHPHSGAPEAEFSHVWLTLVQCACEKSFRTCFCSKVQLKHNIVQSLYTFITYLCISWDHTCESSNGNLISFRGH